MTNQVFRNVRQADGSYKMELGMDNRPKWLTDQTGAFGGYKVNKSYGMDPGTYDAVPESANVTDQYGRPIRMPQPGIPRPGMQSQQPQQQPQTLLGGGADPLMQQQIAQQMLLAAAAGAQGGGGGAVAAGGGGGGGGSQSQSRGLALNSALRETHRQQRFGAGRLGGRTLLGR